jgi:hypothetical protein
MKQRFGALLCVALGAVLITTGLSDSSGGVIGGPPPDCGSVSGGVAVVTCPTGTIAITKTTILPPGSTATPPPGGWKVDITSTTCLNPVTGLRVSITVSVPDNATGTSTDLFVYTNENDSTKCRYALHEEPVAGFTGVFVPASPVHLPFGGGQTGNDLKVSLTNTAEVVTPTPTPTPTTSAPSSDTGSPIASPSSTVIIDTVPPVSSTPIANTGPHEQIRSSVYIGIALCLLGLAMLVAGTIQRRRGRHI